jgi:predicted methyltransferase
MLRRMRISMASLLFSLVVTTGGCKKEEPPPPPAKPVDAAVAKVEPPDAAPVDPIQAILTAADRTEEDRKEDEARKPADLLKFMAVKPGSKVADLGAGGGYLTELLVRAVGPEGTVYAQNNKGIIEKFVKEAWPARLARPVNAKVVRVEREFDDPLPPEAKDLDLVTMSFIYHDLVWLKVDRDKFNKKVFDALKPGGAYIVLDHSAADGAGSKVAEKLHRIEKKLVVDEISKAGFKLDSEADFLINKDDSRAANVFDAAIRGKTDRFVLKFVKP